MVSSRWKKTIILIATLVVVGIGGYFAVERLMVRDGGHEPSPAERSFAEGDVPKAATPRDVALSADATLADLAPQIVTSGQAGAVAEAILIQFARPITTTPDQSVASGTKVSFDPPVKASLQYAGDSALRVIPQAALQFASNYTVRLDALGIDGKVLDAASGEAPSYSFTTPKFDLARAHLRLLDEKNHKAEFTFSFTGGVDPRKLASYVSWGTIPSNALRYRRGAYAHEIIAQMPLGLISGQSAVAVSVRAGVPAEAHAATTKGQRSFDIPLFPGDGIDVKRIALKEGINGFFVQVTCSDLARKAGEEEGQGRQIYHYDDDAHEGMYLSDRCVLDEGSAKSHIRFSPQTAFSVVPARGGFRILADFKGGPVTMTIDQGALSLDGAVLKIPIHQSFQVPPRRPTVGFAVQGRYLPRDSWKNLGLRFLNVDKAEITARLIPPQNLAYWLAHESERADERNSDLIVKKTIGLRGTVDKQATQWIDLALLAPAPPKGVIELAITDLPMRKSTESKRLILTDINLVVKRDRSGRKTQVWALGMHDMAPLSGVRVTSIVKSGRTLAACETDRAGACLLNWEREKEIDPAEAFAIVAQKGDDLTYLRFSDLKTEVSEEIVQGRPFDAEGTPYRAGFWSDRGVYRPGETAHVAAIVRGLDDRAPKKGMPVELKLFDPREKLVRKEALTVAEAGYVAADLRFENYANTGRYRVSLEAAGRELGRYSFNVEEFVPERMAVDIHAESENLLVGDGALFDVGARYLFGGSAQGSRVELVCEIWPGEFKPAKQASFTFGVWYPDREAPKSLALGTAHAVLGEDGKAKLLCPGGDSKIAFAGAARLRARAVVFEGESGRSTQKEQFVPLHPENFYVGLSSGVSKATVGDTVTFQGIVVDWQGEPLGGATDKIEVELVRLETEWDWSWDDGDASSSFRRYLRPVSDGKITLAVKDGKFQGEFKVQNGASTFLLRARLGKALTDLSIAGDGDDYFWYPSETMRDQTPRPLKPQWLELADSPSLAKVGDDLEVSFNAPFKGRVLLTAETDELLASEWREVTAGKVTWSIPIKKFRPNIYVSAFLVKDPHLESRESFMPDRAFGVRSYRIEPDQFVHQLKLTAPSEMKPHEKLRVDLDLGGKVNAPAFVTVAAVDEGVLSLTRFKDPDPLRALFEARALGVETFETIGWNALLPGAGSAKQSGGDGLGENRLVSLVKPVALWSGVVKVDGDGKAAVNFDIPQYRGALRVMAVSFDAQRIGTASAQVIVRDPLVLQTTMPRYLTEADDALIPVTLSNMSGHDQKVKVSLTTRGLTGDGEESSVESVRIVGETEKSVVLAKDQTETVVFRVTARVPVGAAAITVKAQAGELLSYEDLEVPILSALPRSRTLERLALTSGEMDVTSRLQGWMAGTERTSFWVTANPYLDTLGHLRYLAHYPFGCVEQTTSTTRPLLVLRELLQTVDPSLIPAGGSIEDMVKKGIERVLSMQTPSGGFGYWPGDQTPTAWATAYATHMLMDAMKLQYPVPKERVDEAIQWLDAQVVNTLRYAADASEDGANYYDLRKAAPYIHYVLASAGKSYKADIQKLIDRLESAGESAKPGREVERREELYLLKAALYRTGDFRYEGDLKKPDIQPITDWRNPGWSFASDLRARGLMLSVFTDLFDQDREGDALADLVAEGLRKNESSSYTTQELVWGVTGLGRRIAGAGRELTASLKVDGQARKADLEAQGKSWMVRGASAKSKITVEAQSKDQGKLYLVLASEGVRKDGEVKLGGHGLAVSRSLRKSDGHAFDPESELALGETIYVELTIQNTSDQPIENIALVDRLPAGWEIENPRLGRETTVGFIDHEKLWNATYMNIRDDRLELFGGLKPREERKAYYVVRAVVSGRFTMPPLEAEAMYDARIWARAKGGKVFVKGPWKEFASMP